MIIIDDFADDLRDLGVEPTVIDLLGRCTARQPGGIGRWWGVGGLNRQ